MSQPLTPQEKNLFSRYGNNNFSTDAFYNNQGLSSDAGLFTGWHFQNQDELSGKKQSGVAGDWRSQIVDYRRQTQRAAAHSAFNYGSPFGGASGSLHSQNLRFRPPL